MRGSVGGRLVGQNAPPGAEVEKGNVSRVRRMRPWTHEEDQRLAEAIGRMANSEDGLHRNAKAWSLIARQMESRSGKQCRERWLNHLQPGISRETWTENENKILAEAHQRLGNKWVMIAGLLPGRTENSVKNHWNSIIRKRMRQGASATKAVDEMPRPAAPVPSAKRTPVSSHRNSPTDCSPDELLRSNPLFTLATAAAAIPFNLSPITPESVVGSSETRQKVTSPLSSISQEE
mmetsp:Transcript_6151/g.18575  ORF Transcript_6151/g.18575 Transcript_6151/m.18575 type:complete len:234 (-) Transcript_6151:2470-3171(-)